MSIALAYTQTLQTLTCGECGVEFAIPVHLYNSLRENHKTFHCPNGHGRAFNGKSEADKLRDELAREKQRREIAERGQAAEVARAERLERKAARDRKRAAAGVCACCNRTFANVAKHMATKHPEVT